MGGEAGATHSEQGGFILWVTVACLKRSAEQKDSSIGGLRQESLQSSLGPVVELSMQNARVHCTGVPEGTIDLVIQAEEELVRLWAKVEASQRIGFRKYEAVLRFLDVPPAAAKALSRICHTHRVRRVFE
jgi:hypothetical protein